MFLSIASLIFILSSQTLLAQTSGIPNITDILDKAGQYKRLQLLMDKHKLVIQLENQLNTSTQGLTLLAPTDTAFDNLPANVSLNNLSDQEQVELVLYHVLTEYYDMNDFSTISNPVRTQYQDGLNFTSHGSQLNVSSGLVETQINNVLRQKFPLAVYQVDKVLLPNSIFGAKTIASPPSSPPASTESNKTSLADAPSTGNDDSGAGVLNVGSGLVIGVVLLCLGTFF